MPPEMVFMVPGKEEQVRRREDMEGHFTERGLPKQTWLWTHLQDPFFQSD